MPTQSHTNSFTDAQQRTLLSVARASITHAMAHRQPLRVDPADFDAALRVRRAVFVTLMIERSLRGCIGTLEPVATLVEDVTQHAYAAAFEDPRFEPLSPFELDRLSIHLSILTPPQPLTFVDEADLIRQLRPGVDGLLLEDGEHRGTFLPSVWRQLPDARLFFTHLKKKADLPEDYWSATLRVSRYMTESVPDQRET